MIGYNIKRSFFILKYFFILKIELFQEIENCNFSKKDLFIFFLVILLLLKQFTQTYTKIYKNIFLLKNIFLIKNNGTQTSIINNKKQRKYSLFLSLFIQGRASFMSLIFSKNFNFVSKVFFFVLFMFLTFNKHSHVVISINTI